MVDVTFHPSETKIIDLKLEGLANFDKKTDAKGERLCSFEIQPFQEQFEAICLFDADQTKAVFTNRSTDIIKLSSEMIVGEILQVDFLHTDGTSILDLIAETNNENFSTSDQFFCSDKSSIISHFHKGGMTDYAEVNLLTIEGKLHS
jgi:hypothetical protein